MGKNYVEQCDGCYYACGTRISLDSIVHEYRTGTSPEGIAREFELLSLEQVHGAITYYLAHQAEIDTYLDNLEQELEHVVPGLSETDPELYRRLRQAQQHIGQKRS